MTWRKFYYSWENIIILVERFSYSKKFIILKFIKKFIISIKKFLK